MFHGLSPGPVWIVLVPIYIYERRKHAQVLHKNHFWFHLAFTGYMLLTCTKFTESITCSLGTHITHTCKCTVWQITNQSTFQCDWLSACVYWPCNHSTMMGGLGKNLIMPESNGCQFSVLVNQLGGWNLDKWINWRLHNNEWLLFDFLRYKVQTTWG